MSQQSERPPAYAPQQYPPPSGPPPGSLYPQLDKEQPPMPGPYPVAPAPYQQPQPSSVTVNVPHPQPVVQNPPVIVQSRPVQSFIVHIVLSCFVVWCCGCLCGLIAFILAMVAQGYAANSPKSARNLGITSLVFSVVGILIGITGIVLIIVFLTTTYWHTDSECRYRVDEMCFDTRRLSAEPEHCLLGYYKDSYCYYY